VTHSSFQAEASEIASQIAFSDPNAHGIESTTIALLAKLAGLTEPLRQFMKTNPVWGSCAGAILMSRGVENAKRGGQELLGGVSAITARNGYGSQVRPSI
jgi:5'-phosphate synthase pdxT subunit